MRKLLVHLHLYYTDQCDYFVEKLRNIAGCEWDLHVTMVKHEPATEKKITSEFPSATIYIVENRGYDIRPFIQTIKAVDLDKYDFILKLHSKNYNTSKDKINGISYKGYALRDALVDSYLKSPSHFAKLLDYMESHTKAGMMCNNAFYKNVSDGLPEDMGLLKKELARIGIDCNDLHFCAGSMFLARACPYKILQGASIGDELFGIDAKSHSIGSMAHVYERILSIIVSAESYKIKVFDTSIAKKLYLDIVVRTLQPIFENIFSIRRIGEQRVKYLVLLGIRIPLEKRS